MYNNILSLRQSLHDAEQAYKTAQGSMESNTDLIVKKALLKSCRFEYHMALEEYMETVISQHNDSKAWFEIEDVGKEIVDGWVVSSQLEHIKCEK